MRHEYDDNSRTMDRSRRHDEHDRGRDMFDWGEDRERHHRNRLSHDRQRSSGDDRARWADEHSSRGHDERDSDYGPDAHRDGMPRNETERLIASSKVEGTPVYDRNGDKLGSICTLMINKRSGQTEYAVLKYNSDFLGLSINERYYPLDWRELTYDRRMHGYGVEFSEDELEERAGYHADGRRVKSQGRHRRQARFAGWS